MLESVKQPDGTEIHFEYDALGRRTAKINEATKEITRFVWDGNVPLHEWKYNLSDRPQIVANELGELFLDKEESTENLITWIFDEGSFVPSAKITKDDTFSIVSDYLGTPCLMYNSVGNLVWQADLDIYGKVRTLSKGNFNDCPFRYQGQYHDTEVELYYNRFRYYSPESGIYVSQDPIGLEGAMPNFYSYVAKTNFKVDPLGLAGSVTSTLITSGGDEFVAKSRKATLEGPLKDIVESVKTELFDQGKFEPFHGHCGEIRAIRKALDSGLSLEDLKGSKMNAVVSNTGEIKPACDCCKGVMDKLGIDEVGC